MGKIQKSLIAIMTLFWLVYATATLAGIDIIYNIFSPLTALASVLLIASCLKHAGKYKKAAIFVMCGIITWIIADIMLYTYTYILTDNELLVMLSDQMYLMPNYLFGAGLTAYIIADFRKQDIFRLLIDTFLIGVSGYVFIRKLYIYGFGINTYEGTFSYSALFYLVAVMYVIVMMLLILTMRGIFSHTRAGYLVLVSLMVYNLFEMRYTYYTAGGLDPESIYIDIIYMACVCLLGIAFADPSLKKAMERSDQLMREPLDIRKSMGGGWIYGLLLLPIVIVAYKAGIVTENEFYILLISCLAYLFMWKTQQANELTQALLAQQKEENSKLGEQVDTQSRELQVANEQLEKVAYKDALTGLYNRKYGRVHLNQIVTEHPETPFALATMDLNYFKPINENYGLETGDKVLIEVAERLRSLENEKAHAFRVGGDEFSIVFQDFGTMDELVHLVMTLKEVMDAPIEVDGQVFHLSMSIGVAAYPADADNAAQILKFADSARQSIKHRHSRTEFRFYDSELIGQISRQHRLEVKLQSADYDRDFQLYYQPQVDCMSGKLIGMEALIRWIDPVDGFISPGEFIPLAEEMGLMGNIGAWVNRTAMRQIKEWNEKYGRELVTGINVSPVQLRDPGFAERFIQEMNAQEVPAKWLDVEITEGFALNSMIAGEDIIRKLKDAGLSFSVDDFGTGYASFNNMLDFTFDRIKIAKEMIDDIETNHNAYVIVKVIILMAQGLGLKTIAEGVENRGQLDILRDLGCGQIQGFYFGRPQPPDQFEKKWLAERDGKKE